MAVTVGVKVSEGVGVNMEPGLMEMPPIAQWSEDPREVLMVT